MAPQLPTTGELGLDPEAMRVDELAREVLRDNYVHFHINRVTIEEVPEDGKVTLTCNVTRSLNGQDQDIRGEGVGLVDAFFEGVMRLYAEEYPSLKTIEVSDFGVRAGFDGAAGRRSDALAVATLRVKNSEGVEFEFKSATPSVTRSSMRAALDALTFFINSERAYVQLHLALKDAKERRRSDLVQKYRTMMGTLVGATSYSEVIERLKADS